MLRTCDEVSGRVTVGNISHTASMGMSSLLGILMSVNETALVFAALAGV